MSKSLDLVMSQKSNLARLWEGFKQSLMSQHDDIPEDYINFYAELIESLKLLSHSSDHLDYQIESILSFSQLKNGTFNKIVSKFSVKKVVNEVMAFYSEDSEIKNLSVKVHYVNFPIG